MNSNGLIVMRITALLLLIIVNEVLAGGGGGKHHVHFKIHVPDIIKHHIHTKTIFIHVPGGHKKKKMVPKKKETHHEESHHEDWSSWSSYDIHNGHGKGHEGKHHGTKNVKHSGVGHTHGAYGYGAGPSAPGGYGYGYHGHGNYPYGIPHSEISSHEPRQQYNMAAQHHLRDSQLIDGTPPHPVPPEQSLMTAPSAGDYNDPGLIGYSYPPQYGIQQDIGSLKEVSGSHKNEIEPYSEVYEEGYRKGLHSQTGHVVSQDLKNFYDNNFEEGDSANNEHEYNGYKDFDDSANNINDHSSEHDAAAGYNNYHDQGSDSYISAIMDTR